MIVAMVAGTGLVVFLGTRHHDEPEPPPQPVVHPPDEWVSKEARAQLVAEGGGPGPLFAGLVIGGPAPSADARARIAEFAQNNHVDIDLETQHDQLVAIWIDVTFKGGYGSEGADVFALRLKHPSTSRCGGDSRWIDMWAFVLDSGIRLRGNVAINRVQARWEKPAALADLVARADELLGMDVETVKASAGKRWHTTPGGHYLVDAAIPFPKGWPGEWEFEPANLGFLLSEQGGKIVRVKTSWRVDEGPRVDDELEKICVKRWGAYSGGEGTDEENGVTWVWKKRDRKIKVYQPGARPMIVIKANSYTLE